MEVEMDNTRIKCSDLKKCGEIATLLSVGKSEFFLNCGFCEYTFLQLDNFIQHMYEDHLSEFARAELKQEKLDIEEKPEMEDAIVQSEDNTEENEDTSFYLNNFETVEIELDTVGIERSLDIKEEIVQEHSGEEISHEDTFEGRKKVSKAKTVLKNTESNLYAHRTRRETNVKQQTSRKEETDPTDLLVEMDMTKADSELDYEEQIEEMIRYSSNERKQISNYEVDDDGLSRDDDPIDSASEFGYFEKLVNTTKNDSDKLQDKSKAMVKKLAKEPDTILNDAQRIILAKVYKKYACLWNEKDIAYRFQNRRDEALKCVHNDFNNKTGLNLSKYDCNSEIARLRKICSTEKKEKIACTRQKSSYQPTCPYYKEIAYLEIDVPPYECLICRKLLPGLGHYKIHTSSHDGSLPFKCYICGHGFQVATNLTVHQRRHVHDYTYRCEVCNKPCATTTEKKIHMRTHTGEKPFVCTICGYKALTSSHLLVHTRRHQNRRRYKCEICSKSFCEMGALKRHLSIHRNIRDEICNICNKGFINKSQLHQHQLIHKTEKKYLCKICGKRFAQGAGLSGHMKSHGTKW